MPDSDSTTQSPETEHGEECDCEIPVFVTRTHGLSPSAKILYGVLIYQYRRLGYCEINARRYAAENGESLRGVQRIMRELMRHDLLERHTYTPEDAAALLCRKSPQSLGNASPFPVVCAWCGCKTAHLHQHHYPIPKSRGGTDVVNICPNCHGEFHYLVTGYYKVPAWVEEKLGIPDLLEGGAK